MENKNQHTRGPWRIEHTAARDIIIHAEHLPDGEVCRISRQDPQNSGDRSHAAESANAALILAAPDGLAFARSFLTWAAQMRSVGRSLPGMAAREDEANALISKAEGAS